MSRVLSSYMGVVISRYKDPVLKQPVVGVWRAPFFVRFLPPNFGFSGDSCGSSFLLSMGGRFPSWFDRCFFLAFCILQVACKRPSTKKSVSTRGWFQRFCIFTLGEMIQFDGLVQFATIFCGVLCWCVPCKQGLYAKQGLYKLKVLGIYINVQH